MDTRLSTNCVCLGLSDKDVSCRDSIDGCVQRIILKYTTVVLFIHFAQEGAQNTEQVHWMYKLGINGM